MKFILLLACLALYVAHAQAQRCRGRIPLQQAICSGPKDEGHRLLRQCRRNANSNMWWFDRSDRTCKKLAYRGCDGNRNRYCSLADCQKKCRR